MNSSSTLALEFSEMQNTRYSAAISPISDCQRYFSRERMPSGFLSTTLRQSSTPPLPPLVAPADGAKAERDQQHDPDEAVGQVEPQQGRQRNRQQDQHPAHG